MHTITKSYRDFPAAHRQPNHDGHCKLIHGHNWGWDITLTCDTLDENGFVLDVGKMKAVKSMLEEYFDHTLLLNEEDPLLKEGFSLTLAQLAKVVVVPNCGMEGLATLVFYEVARLISGSANKERGLKVLSVTCWEDSKNSATYQL